MSYKFVHIWQTIISQNRAFQEYIGYIFSGRFSERCSRGKRLVGHNLQTIDFIAGFIVVYGDCINRSLCIIGRRRNVQPVVGSFIAAGSEGLIIVNVGLHGIDIGVGL